MSKPEPIDFRLGKADGFYDLTGRARSERRYAMLDTALGRAWKRRQLSGEEYAALGRYALHWASGGFQGALQTLDLDQVFAFNPTTMTGLAKSERQQDHRDAYREARQAIGLRPAIVADCVACFDMRLVDVGTWQLGYRSQAHARQAARDILADAGYRLSQFWRERDRR
jgi:uncharacterized protein (DUF736 family)